MFSVADIETNRLERAGADTLTLDPWPTPRTHAEPGAILWPRTDALRRQLNVLVAFAALLIVAPVMLIIAIAIKLASPGPVLFTQVRVGLDRRSPLEEAGNWRRKVDYGGRLFTLYKFRTMEHRPDGAPEVWAERNDPRIFPLGGFLRKYRLDELPQLFNVLKGDMNIVGPRPEQPSIFMDLREQIDRYPQRQRVLPGITGLAQVNQHYDTCLEDVRRKVAYDLEYIRRQSVAEDLKIMAQTLPAVVLKKGGW
ncbi:MAG TPA: sugar transferase [Longimicrobiales bacterium]|nr:sugar transferase [Longimicrobiales bacterium]